MYTKKNIGATALLGWADISKGMAQGGGYNLVALNHVLHCLKEGQPAYYLQSGFHYSLSHLIGLNPKRKIIYIGNPYGIEHYALYNSSNRAPAIFNINNLKNQLSDTKQNRLVINWLVQKEIQQVYIHSLEGHPLDLISAIKEQTNIKVFIICHDQFYLCPQVHLLFKGKEICLDYLKGEKCENCLPSGSFKYYEKTQAIETANNRVLTCMLKIALKIKNYRKPKNYQNNNPQILKPLPMDVNDLFFNNLSTEDSPFFAAARRKKAIEVLNMADKVFTSSTFTMKNLIYSGLPAHKVKTYRLELPHLARLRKRTSKHKTKSHEIRFCFRGSSQYYKGLHVFLEAISLLSPEIRGKCRFIVRGLKDCTAYESYTRKIPQLELHSTYSLADLESYIQEYDIGVLSHLCFENSPIVLLEHIAAGKPVITAKLGGVTDFIREGKNGWFFAAGNCQDLAQKISEIVENNLLLTL